MCVFSLSTNCVSELTDWFWYLNHYGTFCHSKFLPYSILTWPFCWLWTGLSNISRSEIRIMAFYVRYQMACYIDYIGFTTRSQLFWGFGNHVGNFFWSISQCSIRSTQLQSILHENDDWPKLFRDLAFRWAELKWFQWRLTKSHLVNPQFGQYRSYDICLFEKVKVNKKEANDGPLKKHSKSPNYYFF